MIRRTKCLPATSNSNTSWFAHRCIYAKMLIHWDVISSESNFAGDLNMLMEWTKWSTIGKRIVCYIWVKRVNECSRRSIYLDREILRLGEPNLSRRLGEPNVSGRLGKPNVSRQHPTVTHHSLCIDMPRQQHLRASRMQEQFIIRGQCIDIVFSPFKNQT